jgi:hypothetical protein
MNSAYVYKWTHLPTMNWYVGSRTAKKAHPSDNYICSSKIVKPLILQNPHEWKKEIVSIGSPEEIRKLESDILILLDARSDIRSFNQHNQGAQFVCFGHTDLTKEKIKKSHAFVDKKRPEHAKKLTGIKRKPEDVQKWADAMRGKSKSDVHVQNIKQAKSQGKYITPMGEFQSSRDAALANNCAKSNVLQKCFGYTSSRGKWYPPIEGWQFILKGKS